jgi:hypothetical protein
MIKNLKRLGYKVGNVSGYQDHNFDPEADQDNGQKAVTKDEDI